MIRSLMHEWSPVAWLLLAVPLALLAGYLAVPMGLTHLWWASGVLSLVGLVLGAALWAVLIVAYDRRTAGRP